MRTKNGTSTSFRKRTMPIGEADPNGFTYQTPPTQSLESKQRCPRCAGRAFAEHLWDERWHWTCIFCGFEGLDFTAPPPLRPVVIPQPAWAQVSAPILEYPPAPSLPDQLQMEPAQVMCLIQRIVHARPTG